MTPTPEDRAIRAAMESLIHNGLDGMGEALRILMNEAMKIERSEFLQAAPYERCEARVGQANGFKKKTVDTRVGQIGLQVPQVRNLPADLVGFYPQSLEKGLRSERALKLAIAEMYVSGVSTRKVAQITQELCGFDVSSGQVSRATRMLDEERKAGEGVLWEPFLTWCWMPVMRRCGMGATSSMGPCCWPSGCRPTVNALS